MKLYRRNEGSNPILMLGIVGAIGFVIYEYFQANSSTIVPVTPLTTNTTVAGVSQTVSNSNPANKYIISSADLSAIYAIGVNQLGIQNGMATWSIWAQAYNLFKGFAIPTSYTDNTTQLTASEFGNYLNNWVTNQGLSGLGIIGQNYGPTFNNTSAGYFGLINALRI